MSSESATLTVGQLAKVAGLTVRTLHYYDARGLLVPSQRSAGGYRLYTPTDILRLYRIQALQRIGLSLDEIALALEQPGSSLPQLIAQQLAELDAQIERSTQLRNQLCRLRDSLQSADAVGMTDWLSALALLSSYDAHCSPDELARLAANNNDAHWPPFIRDVRSAMQRDIALDSDEAGALAQRWTQLASARFGGDTILAKKMKELYLHTPELQSRIRAQSGFDADMMQFCLQITAQAHRTCWARHLTHAELTRLRVTDAWGREAADVIAAIRNDLQSNEPDHSLHERWHRLMLELADGDADLQQTLQAALIADADLQQLWGMTAEICAWLSRPLQEYNTCK